MSMDAKLTHLRPGATPFEVLEFIQARWPNWDATDAEVAEWHKALAKMPDDDALGEAISSHYQESNWRSPKIGQIRGHYRKLTVSARLDKKQQVPVGCTGIFVRCIDPPPGKPAYLKFEREVIFPRADQMPSDRHVLRKVAEAMRDHYQAVYGGRWMIFWPTGEEDYTYRGL